MPKLVSSLPKYRLHRASGQALVTLSGMDIYLHPCKIISYSSAVLLLVTWGLGITDFVTGEPIFYRRAIRAFVVLLLLSFSPLILFLVGSLFERNRGE